MYRDIVPGAHAVMGLSSAHPHFELRRPRRSRLSACLPVARAQVNVEGSLQTASPPRDRVPADGKGLIARPRRDSRHGRLDLTLDAALAGVLPRPFTGRAGRFRAPVPDCPRPHVLHTRPISPCLGGLDRRATNAEPFGVRAPWRVLRKFDGAFEVCPKSALGKPASRLPVLRLHQRGLARASVLWACASRFCHDDPLQPPRGAASRRRINRVAQLQAPDRR